MGIVAGLTAGAGEGAEAGAGAGEVPLGAEALCATPPGCTIWEGEVGALKTGKAPADLGGGGRAAKAAASAGDAPRILASMERSSLRAAAHSDCRRTS